MKPVRVHAIQSFVKSSGIVLLILGQQRVSDFATRNDTTPIQERFIYQVSLQKDKRNRDSKFTPNLPRSAQTSNFCTCRRVNVLHMLPETTLLHTKSVRSGREESRSPAASCNSRCVCLSKRGWYAHSCSMLPCPSPSLQEAPVRPGRSRRKRHDAQCY